jgi:aldose sugar dehydrogenase
MSVRLALISLAILGGCASPETVVQEEVSPLTHVSDRNVPIEPGTRRETVVEGLEHPWSLAFLPDGALLVTERPGRLRVVRDGALDPRPIEGVPAVFAQGQGGLLDVSLHPDFAQNRLVYLTYAHGDAQANRTRLARARLEDHRLVDLKVLFEVQDAKSGGAHFGSRIIWTPQKTMLVSFGDGGNPPIRLGDRFIREYAQVRSSALGKVVQFNDEGEPVSLDPFRPLSSVMPGLFTYGHRNIQGLAWDPLRGVIWASEHGALGGDELNRLEPGANYGWPVVSRTREYRGGAPVSALQSEPGKVDPEVLWEVAIAPSGLAIYDGTVFPQWRGDLFVGSLLSLDVRRVDLDDAGRFVGETAIRVGSRVRDVRVGPDGFLYVLTDERTGRILRYVPDVAGQTMPATR